VRFEIFNFQAGHYHSPMKAILASILIVFGCVGCESDVPPAEEAGNKLERGLTGRGTVYQPDRSNDPIIREQSRVGY
jgi:hypothetical protein